MNSHSATQRTRDLISYCITLNEVIRNHRQSPHLDKGRSLSKWSNSMNILVEYLLARRPPREGITESNHIDSIWSLFMCQLPETLDLLRNISQRDLHPPSFVVEDILERVQFHTMATELLKSYYRRYVVSPAVHIAWLMLCKVRAPKVNRQLFMRRLALGENTRRCVHAGLATPNIIDHCWTRKVHTECGAGQCCNEGSGQGVLQTELA